MRKQSNTVEEQIQQKEHELKSIQMQEHKGLSASEDLIKEEMQDLLE